MVIGPDILSVRVERFASLRVSQERMVYVPAEESSDGIAKVVYTSKNKKSRKTFNALDWLARLVTHIPGRYEQTVRYYGYYSNKSRGLRKKANGDNEIPTIILNEMSSKEFRQNWARLIALRELADLKIPFIGQSSQEWWHERVYNWYIKMAGLPKASLRARKCMR